jgi:cellobiose phosphorylase
VPYPVEAWPEGDQRHLSAESALYCRVITEGLFGIEPVGLNKFTMTPRLPEKWNYMNLRNIKAFDHTFDIEVVREGEQEIVTVKMDNGKTIRNKWDGKVPMHIILD